MVASDLTPAAALARLLDAIGVVGAERVALADAAGRTLAEPIAADRDSPACDVSAMDGFAVRSAECAGALPIVGAVAIGAPAPALPPGSALRIVTGAPIPQGADAVLRHEDAIVSGDAVRPAKAPKAGDHIRRRGENARAGAPILAVGARIHAAAASALATFGVAAPLVRRRVRVAIVTTGDELDPIDATPPPWRLRDGNGPALAALLADRPGLDVDAPRRAVDEETSLRATLAGALRDADALLVTGGVSMGERDLVPAALADCGVRELFHRLPQRPGKPLWAGVAEGGRPVLALPGNPVSVLVTARRFALPALAARAGAVPAPTRAIALEDDGTRIGLWWHRVVRVVAPGQALLVAGRGSGDVASTATSDGFVEIPPHEGGPGPWPYYEWDG